MVFQSVPGVDSLSDEAGSQHDEDSRRQDCAGQHIRFVHCSIVVAGSAAVFGIFWHSRRRLGRAKLPSQACTTWMDRMHRLRKEMRTLDDRLTRRFDSDQKEEARPCQVAGRYVAHDSNSREARGTAQKAFS